MEKNTILYGDYSPLPAFDINQVQSVEEMAEGLHVQEPIVVHTSEVSTWLASMAKERVVYVGATLKLRAFGEYNYQLLEQRVVQYCPFFKKQAA